MNQHLPILDQLGKDPAAIYNTRLEHCRQLAGKLQRQNILLSYLRLLWALLLLILLWYVFGRHMLSWPWILLPCFGFGLTARGHSRVLAAALRQRRAIAWYELGLARLEDRWSGLQPRPIPQAATDSLYAADLDLFGPGSLFELLCTTSTNLGETTLADWLLQPANRDEAIARQTAVRELRDRLNLREQVANTTGPTKFALDAKALAAWGEDRTAPVPTVFRWLAPVLAVLTAAAAVWWAMGHPPLLFSSALLINGAITFSLQSRFKPLFETTERVAGPLHSLSELLMILEQQSFAAQRLQVAQNALQAEGTSASRALRSLARLAGAAEQRANLLTKLLDFGALYSVQLALMIEAWRSAHGPRLRPWFRALGDTEALLALSTYHFEHPEDAFPELAADTVFQALALGHPLLLAAQCVRNDVALDSETQMLLISGSNMSGKSTLLRSTGVACVMAMAGAPVRAHSLKLGPLRVAASIQVQDSLQGGRSRFYVEILRLRAICELARSEPPVLFLLDELLAGTNSQDRLIGSTGVVETLLGAGALGLLSTHDLSLTQLGSGGDSRVRNAHLQDRFSEGGLEFDYTLRDGVITRSNGLDLMRLIGLDV